MKVCEKRETKAKTTYGDLKPGDVFRWKNEDSGALRQMCRNSSGHYILTGRDAGMSCTAVSGREPIIHYPNACVCLEGGCRE